MRAKDLFEKSTSQAQFRTMAAAANNPKFAKKVGISQDVAREFHAADRKSDYKKLPDHANESQLNELFDADQQYFKLADGQVIRADFTQAGLNPDGMSSSIKISTVDPKIMPSAATTAVQPWDKARPNIRAAIQKWVQGGQQTVSEIKKGQKDSNGYTKCWPGKHAEGTKKSAVTGKQVRNCVPNEGVEEAANPAQQAAIAIAMKKAGQKPKSQGVAEGSTETPQQQKVRAAITKGMEKWDQNGLATYQSQPAKRNYFARSGWASGQLEGINSIDPNGTVVIELNDTSTAGLVKKLASLGGMPGVKTRQLKATFDPAKANADGVIQATVAEGGMPSSVIKSKQRYSDMSDKDFADLHQNKSDDDLLAMAWRHGHGKGSLHYVNKRKRGQQGVAEARGKDQDQFGGMHQDDFQEKLMRLKSLAGAGPMKTVYDPNKRVYKNMPTAVQPPRPPKK